MAFIPIVVCHYKSTKPKNHTSTLSITYFYTTEYLVHIKINCVCGRTIIFHLLIWLFYLLYCNITSLISPIITLAFLFITYFLQNGILLNQARAGQRPARAWFLDIDLVREVCVCVRVPVCPPPRLVITTGMMWRDMDPI